MDDVLLVKVGERICHLGNVSARAFLVKAAQLGELLVELALGGKLEHEEDTLRVVEVAVQAEDVGVTEVLLDLNLATDLFLNLAGHNLLLVETLEGNNKVRGGLGTGQVDTTKLALAKWTADLEGWQRKRHGSDVSFNLCQMTNLPVGGTTVEFQQLASFASDGFLASLIDLKASIIFANIRLAGCG